MKRNLFILSLVLSVHFLLGMPMANAQPIDIGSRFVASGWMGDGEMGRQYIKLVEGWKENPHSPPHCTKVIYTPGPKAWGGIYWQNKADNWGDFPGADFSQKGYKKITFWARGEKGGEMLEFKAGGIASPGRPYKDSFEVSLGKVSLTTDWQQFVMDLKGKDLSSVIGGFCWVSSESANPLGLTFYLDDIFFE